MAGQPPEPRSAARGVYHLFLGNVTATSLLALGSIVVARLMILISIPAATDIQKYP